MPAVPPRAVPPPAVPPGAVAPFSRAWRTALATGARQLLVVDGAASIDEERALPR